MLIEKDIVILGGGIAGLWLLNRLRNAGFAAVLLERDALGQGQSIASQGMIHGGMKYALGGVLTGASESIADMPQHWQRCLQGQGDVDLRGAKILSDAYYMWPRDNTRSRLNAFLGSIAARGKTDMVDPAHWPAFFRGHIKGPLYRLHDLVLDVPSLLATLANTCRGHIHKIDWNETHIEHDASGTVQGIKLANDIDLRARLYISTSGEGSEDLLRLLSPKSIAMQKRPLQMVVVRHQHPHPVYVHCVSSKLSSTPELTVTTHQCSNGDLAWYLGGELAESGAGLPADEQLAHSRLKLSTLFPWCDLSSARWHSFHINRAEAAQPHGKRPDRPGILAAANLLFCWPTKLTLAPNMGNSVLQLLREQNFLPLGHDEQPLPGLEVPAVALAPWETV